MHTLSFVFIVNIWAYTALYIKRHTDIQSNLNGYNTFGTMQIYSRYEQFEPLKVNQKARLGDKKGVNRGYSNVWSEYDFYFIEWSENMYISWVPKARMKYTFFHFKRWNKSHILDRHLNFLFIIYITFDRRDANLAFARESLTRSFVPWRHDVHVLLCLVTLDMTSETRKD